MPVTDRPTVVAGLRLVRLVGRGGEGDVWEARSPDGTRRALKLVRPEAVAAPEQVAARGDWLRRIDHPALVRVRRTGLLAEPELRGWGLVEMDFVDGHDLSDARAGTQALQRLRPLAEALDRLHRGTWSDGIPLVHRDIKPANLIAAPDGRVVLVDCSSLCGVDRSLLTRIGTPLFAAPEVITGRIGPPADIYSFAATVVALVSGARGDELGRLVDDPWSVDVPDPVRMALAPDPTRRPRRCTVLLDPDVVRLDDWLPTHLGRTGEHLLVREAADAGRPAAAPVTSGRTGPGGPPAAATPAAVPVAAAVSPETRWHTTMNGHDRPHSDPDAAERAEGVLVPAPPPRAVWPFLVLLAAVGCLLAGAVLDPVELGTPWLVTAVVISLITHVGAGRRLLPAVVLPSVSWAYLLGERATTEGVRRSWTRVTLTGVLTAGGGLAAAAVQQAGATASSGFLSVVIGVSLLLSVLTVLVARAESGTLWSRMTLVPATVVGAVVLLAGSVVAAPLKLLSGRPEDAAWVARDALRALGGIAVFGAGSRRSEEESVLGGPGGDGGREDGTRRDDTELDEDWRLA